MKQLSLQVDGPHTELYTLHKNIGLEYFNMLGIEGCLNERPAFLIGIANRSQSCVFQGWDEEAFKEGESEAFKRQELFEKIFRCTIT